MLKLALFIGRATNKTIQNKFFFIMYVFFCKCFSYQNHSAGIMHNEKLGPPPAQGAPVAPPALPLWHGNNAPSADHSVTAQLSNCQQWRGPLCF